jgi:hypothetical protein
MYLESNRHRTVTVIPVICYLYAPLTVQGVPQYLAQYLLDMSRVLGHDDTNNCNRASS